MGERFFNKIKQCRRALAEREYESFCARCEKLDLEFPVRSRPLLADELVEPLLGYCAVAGFVNVGAVCGAWRLPIDQHAKFYRRSRGRRSQHHMKIAGVK